jgi:hypothetical protein
MCSLLRQTWPMSGPAAQRGLDSLARERPTEEPSAQTAQKRGYSRDGKRGKRQIVYGLVCARDG